MTSSIYFVGILLPDELSEKIRSIQKEFELRFESKRQLRIPVHITLIPPFKAEEVTSQKIESALHEFVQKEESITIELKDFGNFRSKVVFVDVVPEVKLLQMKQNLDRFLTEKTELELNTRYRISSAPNACKQRSVLFNVY